MDNQEGVQLSRSSPGPVLDQQLVRPVHHPYRGGRKTGNWTNWICSHLYFLGRRKYLCAREEVFRPGAPAHGPPRRRTSPQARQHNTTGI